MPNPTRRTLEQAMIAQMSEPYARPKPAQRRAIAEALAAAHRREDAIRALCAELSVGHERPFPTKSGSVAERLIAILDKPE